MGCNYTPIGFVLCSKCQENVGKHPIFYDEAMRTFGLYEEALHLFQRIGWGKFFESSWDTFKGPTLEMLSTFKLHTERRSQPHHIIFWAGNEDYSLDMIEINDFLGASPCGIYKNHHQFTTSTFWPFLVIPRTRAFSSGTSATSSIRSLVFQFIQQYLAHTIFARGGNSHVQEMELLVLWCMLQGVQVDLAKSLYTQLNTQANFDWILLDTSHRVYEWAFWVRRATGTIARQPLEAGKYVFY